MVAATAISGLMTLLLLGLYIWRNRTSRNVSDEDEKKHEYDDIDERTDFDIPGFRYVY